MPIENFKITNEHDIEFDIKDIKLCVVNSLRRAMLSEIPILTFDDTWHDNALERSINILKNTSGIHNEFLAHRLSLIPICMYDSDLLQPITTKFNIDTQKREFLLNDDKFGNFILKKKNDTETKDKNAENIKIEGDYLNDQKAKLTGRKDIEDSVKENLLITIDKELEFLEERKKDISLKITSHDIQCGEIDMNHLFKRDIYSNDYILIDLLKTNYNDPDDGEEVNIEMSLTVNNAIKKAQYSPTGTVSLSYNIDDDKCEQAFKYKIEHINKERASKKLDHLNDFEISKLKNSYDLLDKDRYFISDDNNNPISFHLRIESIGFLHSSQIFYDSIKLLEIRLFDIIRCFSIDNYNITYTNKISYELDNSLENEYIFINDENHTIGNLISSYLLDYYVGSNKLLEISGYKMPHPLERKIMFNLVFNKNKNESQLIDIYKNYLKLNEEPPINFDISKNLKLLIFINIIFKIIKDLKNLLEEFKKNDRIYNEPQRNYMKKTIYNIDNLDNKVLNFPSFVNQDKDIIFNFADFSFSLDNVDLQWKQIKKSTKIIKPVE